MNRGRKKTAATPPLPPLAPESETLLAQRLAAVQEALAAGAATEEVAALLAPRPPDPAWDDHLLAALTRLAHPGVPPLLAAVFGSETDRGRRKALKKALHLLKTRGVPVPGDLLPGEEVRAGAPAPASKVVARVSPPLGNGERYAVLEGGRQALGGTVLVARCSDTAGLLEFHALEASRGQREELWQHFREQGLGDWAEVPPAYVVRLLEEAFALNPGAPGAQDYAALRGRLWQHLGRPEDAPDPEAAAPLSEAELAPALEQARHLTRSPYCHSWLPDPQSLAPWLEKIQEAEASPLILAEHQQRARLEAILTEAVRNLFPPESRGLWRRRLLHLAYFFERRSLPEEAKALRAAAQDLTSRAESPLLGESPFLLALVHFAVMLAREYQRPAMPERVSSALVTPPETSPLILKRR